jgi:hypothetical protein
LAKNRYGWNKRIKEIARKMKQEEKLKRRQSKSQEKPAEESSEETETDSGLATAAGDSPSA